MNQIRYAQRIVIQNKLQTRKETKNMADLNIESLKIKSEIKGKILENVKGITSAQMLLLCKAFDDATSNCTFTRK